MSVQQCSGFNRTGERRGERCGQTKRVSHPYFCARHADQQHQLRETSPAASPAESMHDFTHEEGYSSDSSMRGERIDDLGRRVRISVDNGTRPTAQQTVVPMDLGANAAALNTLLGLMNLSLQQRSEQSESVSARSVSVSETKPVEVRAAPFVSYELDQCDPVDSFMRKQKEQHLEQDIALLKKQQRDRQMRLMKALEDVKETAHNMIASIHHLKIAIEEGEL